MLDTDRGSSTTGQTWGAVYRTAMALMLWSVASSRTSSAPGGTVSKMREEFTDEMTDT
jgi:hypothetical protein